MRPGWPVELKRAGSEFWSVVVGPDGTAYALAIEPESSPTSSASILAIAPDSTVRYTHDDHQSLGGQPLGSTTTVTSGVMPLKTLIATL